MFDKMGATEFLNRAHIGEYCKIQFETYIEVRGKEEIEDVEATLHYVKQGEGDPLILLHGLGQSIYAFRENIKALSENFTVYAIDLPGHGFSDKPQIGYSTEEISLCIEAFMKQKGIEKAHFCTLGESAVYALDFVLHNKDVAENLIFISPTISSAKQPPIFPLASQISGLMFNKNNFEKVLSSMYFDRTVVTESVLNEYFSQFQSREFRQILKIYMQNYVYDGILEQLLDIDGHILIIRGTDDHVSPPLMEGIAEYPAKDLRTFTIKNCGFLATEEKKERVNEAIIEFCKIK